MEKHNVYICIPARSTPTVNIHKEIIKKMSEKVCDSYHGEVHISDEFDIGTVTDVYFLDGWNHDPYCIWVRNMCTRKFITICYDREEM